MSVSLPIRLIQFNPLVGDIEGNATRVLAYLQERPQPAIWVFPELALCGYPPEDLLLRDDFLAQTDQAIARLAAESGAHWLVVGAPQREGDALYNAAVVCHDGAVQAVVRKQLLPHYDVFDEQRYFTRGTETAAVQIADHRFGILICEDLWQSRVASELARDGAQTLLCLNASPFDSSKGDRRLEAARSRVQETGCAVCYVNQVGGQDELVFDGASFVLDASGELLAQSPSFVEAELECQDADSSWCAAPQAEALSEDAMLYQALVLGVRDYVDKHHSPGVLVGLSGGIDSALTLTIAVDALGADRVEALAMPSRYTSEMSVEDADLLAERLAVVLHDVSIESTFAALCNSLGEVAQKDLVQQNLQARIRGLLLMAWSNHSGKLLLTTGNKSEMAVGYATLYGDMAGGFAPLKDVFKTRVYDLARWRNREQEVIPERIVTRAPSAELRADQKDSDSLPEYPVLDAILRRFIEEDCAPEAIIAEGFEADTVHEVVARVLASEYKRRQAPPGVKTTQRAFGRDRRYPITSAYRP